MNSGNDIESSELERKEPEFEPTPPSPEDDEYSDMDETDKGIAALRIQFPKISIPKIADKINVSESTVKRRLQKATLKKYIADNSNYELEMAQSTRRRILLLQQFAVEKLTDIIAPKDDEGKRIPLNTVDREDLSFVLSHIDVMKGLVPELTENTHTHDIPNAIQVELVGDESESATG